MTLSLLLEALTAGLLMATIVACFALHRRVAALRDGQAELNAAMLSFAEAAGKAEAGVQQLRQASEAAGQQLQREIDRARRTAEELAQAIRAGDRIAGRLAQAAEARRG